MAGRSEGVSVPGKPGARPRAGGPGGEGSSDEELFARFRLGDREGLVELLARYERPLFNYLARMLGGVGEAEDAYQEVCLRLLRSADTYDPTRSVRPWLYAIATNVCRRLASQRVRREALPLAAGEEAGDEAGRPAAAGVPEPPSPAPGPPELAEEREWGQRVRLAVARLPEHQREVFVLSQYQGLTYSEVARALGRPLGTVKSDMFYALRALRRRLGGSASSGLLAPDAGDQPGR
jgi:RNA polymerase sigma-70 factor (ECF subfamily)